MLLKESIVKISVTWEMKRQRWETFCKNRRTSSSLNLKEFKSWWTKKLARNLNHRTNSNPQHQPPARLRTPSVSQPHYLKATIRREIGPQSHTKPILLKMQVSARRRVASITGQARLLWMRQRVWVHPSQLERPKSSLLMQWRSIWGSKLRRRVAQPQRHQLLPILNQ